MIKYVQEKQDDKLTLNISNMTMVDWYADATFAVHADMKIHMEGVLTTSKGATQTISMKQKFKTKSFKKDIGSSE